jgi:hypothetical protein
VKNLVIGNTSQVSYYFPEKYEKISSRDIDYVYYKDKKYDRIYICFAEQRTYLNNEDIFDDINVDYTMKVVKFFKNICNKIIIYGTSELWNGYNCPVTIDYDFMYARTNYIYSKDLMVKYLKNMDDDKIIILHPFNYNTPYRKGGFLFAKIFDSIINKKQIEIGDTYFYRDIIHPKYVVERSILSQSDEIIGSGRLTHVNDFIRSLYSYFNMDYNYYVKENIGHLSTNRNIFYLKSQKCLYNNLFNDTVKDIEYFIKLL